MAKHSRRKPRPGYVIVGYCTRFRHYQTGRIVIAPPGKAFPIYRRVA